MSKLQSGARPISGIASPAAESDVGVIRQLASSPVVWRGAIAVLGSLALLFTRSGATDLFDEIVGLSMIAVASGEQLPRLLGAKTPPWWRSVVIAVAGGLIWLWPSETGMSVGLVAAATIAVYGLAKFGQGLRTVPGIRRRDRLARGVMMVALAIVVALFPEATLRLTVVVVGLAWILQAAVVASAIGRGDPVQRSNTAPSPQDNLDRWFEHRPMSRSDRERVDADLFFEGSDRRRRVFRVVILMGLATVIATFGIATDSTAVVIGAMLIAPLMTPILATAAALLHGWPDRAFRSAAIVVVAMLGSIALAWTLAAFIPTLAAVVANDEVMSRTAPHILDLAIAMAAGAAGAFAVIRSDVSDTLPGVAVAIALVPPLAVIGVTLHAGELDQALGALLLFGTNLVSIVAMASIVFVLTGYVAWSQLRSERRRLRASYATVAVGVVALLIPLGLTARNLMEEASMQRATQEHLTRWLGDESGFRVSELDVDGKRAMVTLRGSGDPPLPRTLHDALADELGSDLVLELRVVPEDLLIVGENGSDGGGNQTKTG